MGASLTLGYLFGSPGPMELLIIAIIILLLFGNRLPSVMRSLGRGVVEFKKGLQGIENGETASSSGQSSESAKSSSSTSA
jgi:sec-independent protein translocase protein TatA